MPSINIARTIARELLSFTPCARTPEPDLVMADAEQVQAYTEAGRECGVMAPVYLHHCSQVCDVIRPGDTVVDLACGPATQLAQVARLNPDCHFIGVDLSAEMLRKARAHVADLQLANVEFRDGDISRLEMFGNASVDAVMTTMALHHLPTRQLLLDTFAEVARILKPDGGVYLVDFGHLKSERSIREFAYQYADRQPEIFTIDYLNSLRAAFPVADFRAAAQALDGRAQVYTTLLVPYMVALKSAPRRAPDSALQARLRELHDAMPAYHQRDFKDLSTFFRLGGLRSAHLPR
ncbi:class I SAM-dependent methyltransferase [Pseudothauera lacus]|uniref:Class I SAM-dependent methyltransferase n=1 Tax=Pseudothauera lacus TaxID=2136175 RepID=A0A2T4IGP8_9RHOO|nr:class I SAM-dependent methyltransferase [Pseudothauera lacus]PTD96954.1 class I SAM-dependent methyltransferase [Pseudothauera lacus]